LALIASLILWNLPFGALVLYPFKLFATWLHEMSHGIVMLATGAGFDHLEIFRDTSGFAHAQRGVGRAAQAAIASAGYMGTALFGGGLLIVSQTRIGARTVLGLLAISLGASALFWVQNQFGLIAVLVGCAVFTTAALVPSDRLASFAVNFVAAQACINAVLDIRVLFRSSLVINGKIVGASDAHKMAESTFGNHWLWAGIWLAWSLLIFYIALRIMYLRQRRLDAKLEPETDGS